MKKVIFEYKAFENFNEWIEIDKKTHKRIIKLIKDINRNPFSGIGKPEALKYDYSGYYSRRIDNEHRLIYKVTEQEIIIISCKYHY